MTKRSPTWGWVSIQDFATWVFGIALTFYGATRSPTSEVLVFAGMAVIGYPLVKPKGGE